MIEINNLTTVAVDEEFFKKVAKIVLEGEKKEGNLSIALVGQGRMRELNKRYRKKNRATDVLAFPESKILLKRLNRASLLQEIQSLGEIIICLREVRKNAKRFESTIRALAKGGDERSSLTTELSLAEAKVKMRTKFSSPFEKELARVLIHGILHILGYVHERTEKEAKIMEEKQNYYFSQI